MPLLSLPGIFPAAIRRLPPIRTQVFLIPVLALHGSTDRHEQCRQRHSRADVCRADSGFSHRGFQLYFLPGWRRTFQQCESDALNYSWDFGDGSPQVNDVANIDHQFFGKRRLHGDADCYQPRGQPILQQTIEVVVSGVATGEPQVGRYRATFPETRRAIG